MTYPGLDTVNATTDLSELLIYVNVLTNGVAMPLVLVSFFLIAFVGGSFAQLRFRGAIRLDLAFAAASFVTFGMAVIMSIRSGLLNPIYLIISLAIAILGVVWVLISHEP